MNDTNVWAYVIIESCGLLVISPDSQADAQASMGSNSTTASYISRLSNGRLS